jgi:hypothetical protein
MQTLINRPLYQIRQDHINLLTLIEENDGELTPELDQALSITKEEFESKALSYGFITKTFDDTTDVIDKEIKRLQELKQKAAKRSELFKQRLAEAMNEFGIEKLDTPTLKLSFRKSESVEIVDEEKIPEDYLVTKQVTTISKTAIKEAIKEGQIVPGAELKQNRNLQIK